MYLCTFVVWVEGYFYSIVTIVVVPFSVPIFGVGFFTVSMVFIFVFLLALVVVDSVGICGFFYFARVV